MLTRKLIAFFIFGIGFSGMAMAEESPWYVGLQAGQIGVDEPGFDSAFGMGAMLGYKFNKLVAVEGGFISTGQDGDVTVNGVEGNWDLTDTAVYAVLRSSGDFYAKGKLGFFYERVKVTVAGVNATESDPGFSWGIGAGWRVGEELALELEYTQIKEDLMEGDVDFIGLGLNLGF